MLSTKIINGRDEVGVLYIRFTTKGALGESGSLDVDEDDDEDFSFLKSPQNPCFSFKHTLHFCYHKVIILCFI